MEKKRTILPMSEIQNVVTVSADQAGSEYLADLARHRELFFFFSWRDIIVRYKQAFFGVAWALIRPLLNMILFTFLFGRIANLPSDGIPYSLFVLSGTLAWQLLSNSIIDSCTSLVNNAALIGKSYFPRMIIPLSQIVVHLVDFAISLAMMLVLLVVTSTLNFLTILMLPLFLFQCVMLAAGIALWLSALTVNYRDFRLIVPFFVQFGLFLSPVGYGTFVIPEKWQTLYMLNPLVGIIEGFRWAMFGVYHSYLPLAVGMSLGITTCVVLSGYWYFRKMERTFADSI